MTVELGFLIMAAKPDFGSWTQQCSNQTDMFRHTQIQYKHTDIPTRWKPAVSESASWSPWHLSPADLATRVINVRQAVMQRCVSVVKRGWGRWGRWGVCVCVCYMCRLGHSFCWFASFCPTSFGIIRGNMSEQGLWDKLKCNTSGAEWLPRSCLYFYKGSIHSAGSAEIFSVSVCFSCWIWKVSFEMFGEVLRKHPQISWCNISHIE